MATLTWRCEAKPRFLQTHLGDKQRCTQKRLGRDRGTPECRVETLKALVQRPQCRPPMPGWRAADYPTGCAPQPEHTKTIISSAHRKSPRGFNSTESHAILLVEAIHAQESRDAADRKARAIVDDLRTARMNTAADLVERSVSETLTYYAFPDIHWQKIRTNNPLERIMREIRRRTRVVGAFPDGQSCLNLAAARLRYIVGTAWSTKCYMNMRPLYQPQLMQTEAVA